ncbi:MAG: sulfatase-like hydrolase/transferase [Planctomycetaceae bacterium]
MGRVTIVVLLLAITTAFLAAWCFRVQTGVFPGESSYRFCVSNYYMLIMYVVQRNMIEVGSLLPFAAVITVMIYKRYVIPLSIDGRLDIRCVLIGGVVFLNSLVSIIVCTDYYDSPFLIKGDRIEAFRDPFPGFAADLEHRVNPVISFLVSLNTHPSSSTSRIPENLLTPINSLQKTTIPPPPNDQKSVILIVIESFRQDVVFNLHHNKYVMPNLTRLAREGTFFKRAIANSTHSDYSDPTIVSSLYPLRKPYPYYYQKNEPWPKTLLHDHLKDYGYKTAMVSSQNETWSNMHLFYGSVEIDYFVDARSSDDSKVHFESGDYFDKWTKEIQLGGKVDDAITRQVALDWIKQREINKQKYFMLINFQTSHFPYIVPGGQQGPFHPAGVDSSEGFTQLSEENIERIKNSYYNALNYVDGQIKELVSHLEDSGHRDSTIVVITGDHGEAFRESGHIMHAAYPADTVLNTGIIINCPEAYRIKSRRVPCGGHRHCSTISGLIKIFRPIQPFSGP